MRIGLFSWETLHSVSVGGVAVHVTELAAGLERRGHEVHVFTRMGEHQARYDRVDGVHYHRCPFALNPNFVDEVNGMCRSFTKTCFEVEDYVGGGFDVIHAHDWMASNAAVWVKEARGRKSVFTVHSTEFGRNGNRFFSGAADHIQAHERHGTYCADHVITVSNQLKSEVQWLYQVPDHKTSVVYNGANPRCFDYDLDAGRIKEQYNIAPLDPMILFVGRMVVQKGPDILVQSIPYILHYWPNAKFVFVGDGHMRAEV
ncbi:MAG: glycosyltransferase family 4 protein, partial [Myxococcota bacterium]